MTKLNIDLLTRLALLERQPGGTTAPIAAALLGVPRSTVGKYLSYLRGGRRGERRLKWCVLCQDVAFDEDFLVRVFSRRKDAREEAARLNAKFMRLCRGMPTQQIPLYYSCREHVTVGRKRRAVQS